MPEKITAKTGNAQIKKLGQTKGNQYGTNPFAKNTKRQPAQDLNPKG